MMNKYHAILLIFALLFFTFSGWYVVSIPLAVYFSLYYNGAWLVPLALMIDAYFGALETFPKLTAVAFLLFVCLEFIKPRILWQNRT
jgi:hypothetical protein